jgi:hypothetical protein
MRPSPRACQWRSAPGPNATCRDVPDSAAFGLRARSSRQIDAFGPERNSHLGESLNQRGSVEPFKRFLVGMPTRLLQEIARWFPQRSLSDTPRSVRAWRTLHAIERIRRYGGAWPKDGCGALNWLKITTRSGKVAASESWIGSPHSLGLTSIWLRRSRLPGRARCQVARASLGVP